MSDDGRPASSQITGAVCGNHAAIERADPSARSSSSSIAPYAKTATCGRGRPAVAAPRSTCSSAHASASGNNPTRRITPSAISPASSSIFGPLAET